jgi:hypothetical protein
MTLSSNFKNILKNAPPPAENCHSGREGVHLIQPDKELSGELLWSGTAATSSTEAGNFPTTATVSSSRIIFVIRR